MTTPCPQAATAFDFEGVQTARPVVSAGLSRWSEGLAHLLGYNLHAAGGCEIGAPPAGHTGLAGLSYAVSVPYCRSPGAQVVRVSVELQPTDDDDTQTVTVTLPTGATWLDAQGLDGSVLFPNPPLGRTVGEELSGWVDVTGVTVGSLGLHFTFGTTPTGSKAKGIRRANVVEVPRASLDNTAAEPVLDGASVRPGRLVVAGDSSTTAGAERVFYLLDLARSADRRHVCFAGLESADSNTIGTTPHWARETATYGQLTWQHASGSGDVALFLRARDLHADGSTTRWKFVFRYRTSNSTACGIKLYAEGGTTDGDFAWVPAAAATAQTISLSGTSGTWTWKTVDVTMPGDGTNELVKVWFEAKGPGAGKLLAFSVLAPCENEP